MVVTVNLQIIKFSEETNQLSECTLFYQNIQPSMIDFQNHRLVIEQRMTIDEAHTIAMAICEKQGWPFFAPIHIASGKDFWVITTNYDAIGCNAH